MAEEYFEAQSKIEIRKNKIIGKGHYNTKVYSGIYRGKEVAVKVLDMEYIDQQKAQQEVNVMLKLSDHENILKFFGKEFDDNSWFMALELCDQSLVDYVKHEEKPVDEVNILRQITMGLEHLHKNGIIHGDLKPANILLKLGQNVTVKIADFGISRVLADHQKFVNITRSVGTNGWIAPEILRMHDSVDDTTFARKDTTNAMMSTAADIFSLGLLFYYTLTWGIHPFGPKLRRQVNILDEKFRIEPYEIKCAIESAQWNLYIIRLMISGEPEKRPSATCVLSHPFFWGIKKYQEFFLKVEETKILDNDVLILDEQSSETSGALDTGDILRNAALGANEPVYVGRLFHQRVIAASSSAEASPSYFKSVLSMTPCVFSFIWLTIFKKKVPQELQTYYVNTDSIDQDVAFGFLKRLYGAEF